MPTKAEIKHRKRLPKLKIRTGDKVMIIAGKDKGEIGFVAAISPVQMKAMVLQDNPENPDAPLPLNAAIKHRKAKFQGEQSARLRIPVPIHISNLMVIDPETNEPTRVGRKVVTKKTKGGEKKTTVRFGKKSGKNFDDQPNLEKKD